MTIKRQFILLSSLLFIIPLVCVFFTLIHHYVWSSKRMILTTNYYSEREMSKSFTHEEKKIVKKYFANLPPDVEGVLLNKKNTDDDFFVLLSTIPEYIPGDSVQIYDIWNIVQTQSDEFFYQFTSPKVTADEIFITINRIPKERRLAQDKTRVNNLLYVIISFLFIIVFLILFVVVLISRNIFRSISILEKNTEAIANGNLDTQINIPLDRPKANEITNISNSLEKMRLSLVEAQNRKIKLIMGISHDLRTPVAVVKGYTEALKDDIITDPKEIKNTLELIDTKTNQLEAMIDTLINLTKMNSMEIRNTLTRNSITNFIIEFFNDCTDSIQVFDRKLKTDIKIYDDINVPFDCQLVKRAFENLFNNALRYTKDGDSIFLYAEQEEHEIIVKISDSGIGISEEDLPHIFDLFYRGTTSRREEGMGIGLSVVQNIINIHNWTIEVESKINEGTCFTIRIPC